MKKELNKKADELRPQYDLSKLKGKVRGKYFELYKKDSNVILLEPDVAKHRPK